MSDSQLTTGGKHQLDKYFGFSTVSLSAGAEDTNVIDVTCTLTDLYGNTLASADAWVAEVVGEPAGDYVVAETGAGTGLSVTGHNELLFTFSAAGAATISVTDVSGASGETVYLLLRPANTFGKPNYVACTFD